MPPPTSESTRPSMRCRFCRRNYIKVFHCEEDGGEFTVFVCVAVQSVSLSTEGVVWGMFCFCNAECNKSKRRLPRLFAFLPFVYPILGSFFLVLFPAKMAHLAFYWLTQDTISASSSGTNHQTSSFRFCLRQIWRSDRTIRVSSIEGVP